MKIDARLRVSLLHTVAIVAAASALWIFEVLRLPETGFAFQMLLGPVLAAAFISMVVSLLPWIQPKDRLRQALRLPEEFRARTALALRIAVRLLRAGAWMAILMSAGLSLAGTRPDPGTYYNLIGGLTGIFVFVAVVRASSVRFPVASQIFPVPLGPAHSVCHRLRDTSRRLADRARFPQPRATSCPVGGPGSQLCGRKARRYGADDGAV